MPTLISYVTCQYSRLKHYVSEVCRIIFYLCELIIKCNQMYVINHHAIYFFSENELIADHNLQLLFANERKSHDLKFVVHCTNLQNAIIDM